jgi:Fe-S cluster assembly protein SufD
MQAFVRLGFPTTKHEEWKYTSLRNLIEGNFAPAFRQLATGIDHSVDYFYDVVLPHGFGSNVVVLVNGHFDPHLSRLTPGLIQVGSLKSAIEKDDAAVLAHYTKLAAFENNALVALNTAIAADGYYLHIPRNVQFAEPINVIHLGIGEGVAANSRTLILVDDLSEAKVVETWYNWNAAPIWENHVSEIFLGSGAKFELSSIQNEIEETYSLTNFTQVVQGKDSKFTSVVMSSQGNIVRNDLQVRHEGTGCETYLNGLTLLEGKTHVDHHTLVDHAMPHCYSNENYKTVLDGKSTAVFNGKVMVRPDAQKTNAFQSNKTLLLSEGASVQTKPQLEIFADDVKCSHGATTGRLDETALFYMRSRGLSAPKAKALLTYAFGAEVLEKISTEALRDTLETYLMQRLGGE